MPPCQAGPKISIKAAHSTIHIGRWGRKVALDNDIMSLIFHFTQHSRLRLTAAHKTALGILLPISIMHVNIFFSFGLGGNIETEKNVASVHSGITSIVET